MEKHKKEKVIATLRIKGISDMTQGGLEDISSWLRGIADNIEREPHIYSKTFSANYITTDETYTMKG